MLRLIRMERIVEMKSAARVIVFLSAVLAFSCSTGEQLVPKAETVVTLNKEIKIPSSREILLGGDPVSLGAMAIYPVNNDELVVQLMTGEDCLRWIHMPTGETRSLIRRGRGPSELMDAGICGKWTQGNGDIILAAYSISNPLVVTINLTECLKKGDSVFDNNIPLPTGTLYALSNQEGSWCYSFTGNGSLAWQRVNWQGEVTAIYCPFGESELPGWEENYFAATALTIPEGKIVMAMNSFPRLLILDPLGGRSIEASFTAENDADLLSKIQEEKTTGQEYYMWVIASEKNIYALCLDPSQEDMSQPRQLLHVYTKDGCLDSVYSLEDVFVNFVVSRDGESITGINMDGQLIRYRL